MENPQNDPFRPTPADLLAERVLLASMMSGDASMIDDVAQRVRPNAFFKEANKVLAEAIFSTVASIGYPDILAIRNWIEGANKALWKGATSEDIEPYITGICEERVNPALWETYAESVRLAAMRRQSLEYVRASEARILSHIGTSDELADAIQSDAMKIGTGFQSASHLSSIGPKMPALVKSLRDRYQRGTVPPGLKTGFRKFDIHSGGLEPGEVFTLAGATKMGKTAASLCMAWHVAVNNHGRGLQDAVAIFSMEMSEDSLTERLICQQAEVNSQRIRSKMARDDEYEKLERTAEQFSGLSIHVDETPEQNLSQIRRSCRNLKASTGLALVIIDYVQLMGGETREHENENARIAHNAQGIKNLAKELKCPIIMLSQLSGGIDKREDKRPKSSDIYNAGPILKASDHVGFVYRPQYYAADQAGDGTAEAGDVEDKAQLIIELSRRMTPFTEYLAWHGKYTKYESLSVYEERLSRQGKPIL